MSSRTAERGRRAGRAVAPVAVGPERAGADWAARSSSISSSVTVSPGSVSTASGPLTGTLDPSAATIRLTTPSPGAITS